MSSILGSYRALVEGTITPAELDETTKFQKYNLYNSNDAKKLSQTIRDAQGETDDKKAQALWKDALKQAKDLKAKASKIPPNDFGDWVIDLCLKPIWWFLGDVFISSARGDSVLEMSRSQAMAHFDQIINNINRNIN